MKKIVRVLLGAFLGASAVGSQAAIVSVDMVPGGAIDTSRVGAPADGFDVDVVVEDALDLAGFQFDLSFDPALLSATLPTPVLSGGLFGGFTFELSNSLLGGVITFAESSLDFTGIDVVGPTRLGSIHFTALGEGMSAIALSNVLLSDSLGASLAAQSSDGAVTSKLPIVIDAAAPESVSLAMLGLLAMSVLRKRRV